MKAIVYRRYGEAELAEVEKPSPAAGEVLVRVRAAAVNPLDWHFVLGLPKALRLATGLRKPRKPRAGVDVAGVVETAGGPFQPGDEVFGNARGAFAEYVCTPASRLTGKPPNVTFEEAAAVPVAGFTALQSLRDGGRLRPGHKVLINGAAGGVGTFAVQIAKAFGAEVTGVCSTRNVEMIRALGAVRVIDYTREDFTASGDRYDVIVDCVATRPLSACRRILTRNGVYVLVGALANPFGRAFKTLLLPRCKILMARAKRDDLEILRGMLQSRKIKPVIDRTYELAETGEAIRHAAEGHARGKIVVVVG